MIRRFFSFYRSPLPDAGDAISAAFGGSSEGSSAGAGEGGSNEGGEGSGSGSSSNDDPQGGSGGAGGEAGNSGGNGGSSSGENNTPTYDFNSILAEKSGGKLKSEQEFLDAISRLDEYGARPDLTQFPDLAKEVAYLQKGGTREQFQLLSRIENVEKMDHKERIITMMEIDYPELSKDQIRKRIEKKYPTLAEDADLENMDEEELQAIEDAKFNLVVDGKAAGIRLTEKLKELEVPEPEKKRISQAEEAVNQQKAWESTVDNTIAKIGKISFDFPVIEGKKGESFNWDLDADKTQKDHVVNTLKTLKDGAFWNPIATDASGQFSMEKLVKSILMVSDPKFQARYAEHFYDQGQKAIEAEIKNKQGFGAGNQTFGGSGSENNVGSQIAASFRM